jgi:hypothetical protein
MAEQESMTQIRDSQEATRSKGEKGKAVFKRSKADRPEENAKDRSSTQEQTGAEPDPHVIARIQQRAYWLYEASGFENGHDLEHWLEAERQVMGSSERTPEKQTG